MFRFRAVTHTDWLQYFVAKDSLNPSNLYLIQDLSHHNQMINDSAPFLSSCPIVWMIKNLKVLDFSVYSKKWAQYRIKKQIQFF